MTSELRPVSASQPFGLLDAANKQGYFRPRQVETEAHAPVAFL